MALIEVKNINKQFQVSGKSFYAVKNVSFSIEEGQTFGLVGESGCGKSTIALSAMALQSIDSGEIIIEGKNIFQLSKEELRKMRPRFRMLFQNPESVLNPGMTFKQVLLEELEKLPDLDKNGRLKLIGETIEQVGLKELHLERYPSGLSTGEKQRAAIAKAIITRPKFLLCDEPVASLDLSLKTVIIDLLMKLQKELNLSYLYISHNLSLVKTIAHKIGVMYMGYLVEVAPASEFDVKQLRHPYSRLLLASVPSLNPQQYAPILRKYPDIDPTRFPTGCPFRNRCPHYLENKEEICEKEFPNLEESKPGHKLACHFPLEPKKQFNPLP